MNIFDKKFSRRELLKIGALSAGALAFQPHLNLPQTGTDFPDSERLGRNCIQGVINVRSKPSADADAVGVLYEDAVVAWLREVVGEVPVGRQCARWVETPDGYIYAPSLQPVLNKPNTPLTELPTTSLGKGMWAEVSVPYTPVYLENDKPVSPWLQEAVQNNQTPRLYYSQILWIDDIRTGSDGQVQYRINERYGPGDLFWSPGEAFRPLTDEEIQPISPDVENKKIVVDVTPTRQILTCYEGNSEVYACQISSGAKWNSDGEIVDKWGTPVGDTHIWRKTISIHMIGGSAGGGYDLAGIGWSTFFDENGVAIHSTFWHNEYGTPKSHGCVNASPDDAKFVFRWTTPKIPYDPGDETVSGTVGTEIQIIEA